MSRKQVRRYVTLFLSLILVLVMPMATNQVYAATKITLKSGAAAPSTIYAGHVYNLKVAGQSVKFYSSNKKVATIGITTGTLKPVAPGTVKITVKNAKTGKAVASKTFTVLKRATSVEADSEVILEVGEAYNIQTQLSPSNSTDVIRFASSDKTIATVGATSGKVNAKAKGEVYINVYAKATKATANSNKNNKVTTTHVIVVDSKNIIRLKEGYLAELAPDQKYWLLADKKATFNIIEGKDLADIDGSKLIIYSETGKVVIEMTDGVDKTEYSFNIVKHATNLEIENSNLTLTVGEDSELELLISPEDTTDIIKYVSSNEEVVKVSETGEISACGEGEADIIIYAKATEETTDEDPNNKKVTVHVTVKPADSIEPTDEPTEEPVSTETPAAEPQ